MSYVKMADYYDRLMAEAPYDKWVEFAIFMFKTYGTDLSTVADLGCGTGRITRQLAKSGYQLYGIDASEDMLTHANMEAMEQHVAIDWIHQDLRDFQGLNDLDAAVSFCDVINYLTTEEDVKKAFRNIHQSLKPEGLFLFDVHSLQHVESNLKEQTFAEIYDDVSYVWFCEPGESEGEVLHDLTFFVLDTDQYDRFDEQHHQRTFSVNTYQTMLQETGFECIGVFGDFSTKQDSIANSTERIFFVAKKNSRS
jgi:2-polyprenyl-3-methyl-5-hydroxy-6-metoxy-1,4-benzoquinol methylase